MIKAIAIDDEPPALKVIESFCSHAENLELQKTFTSPNEALKYLRKFPVDLIFLDINMPSITGIDFYKSLERETMVIFTTAYSEYAVEGFNLNAVDYLLKPFTLERFQQAIKKAQDYYSYSRQLPGTVNQSLYIRADYSLIKINFSEIVLIESLDDYLKIYLTNDKIIVARMTMKSMVEKLPVIDFIRVHRSFIVPFNKISHVRNKIITISNKEIPIGGNYEEAFFRVFKV
jgi:DNA-binding LytR/AlgR family response regulator